MRLFADLRCVLVKELLVLWRAKHGLVAVVGFALLSVVVASFAFRPIGYGLPERRELTPGILWIIFFFSGIITLNHSFAEEGENDALRGVLLTGISPGTVFIGKFVATYLLLNSVYLCVMLLHRLLFDVAFGSSLPLLCLIAGLASIGFVSIGTLLASMAASTNAKELILPILLFPLMLPNLASAVFLSEEVLHNGRILWDDFLFTFLICFNLVALVSSWILFEFVFKE